MSVQLCHITGEDPSVFTIETGELRSVPKDRPGFPVGINGNYLWAGGSALTQAVKYFTAVPDTLYTLEAQIHGWVSSPPDEPSIGLRFINAFGHTIKEVFSPFQPAQAWKLESVSAKAPENAYRVGIVLRSVRRNGYDNDGYFDDIKLFSDKVFLLEAAFEFKAPLLLGDTLSPCAFELSQSFSIEASAYLGSLLNASFSFSQRLDVSAFYSSGVNRLTTSSLAIRWDKAIRTPLSKVIQWDTTTSTRVKTSIPWERSRFLTLHKRVSHNDTPRVFKKSRVTWDSAEAVNFNSHSKWKEHIKIRLGTVIPWEEAMLIASTQSIHSEYTRFFNHQKSIVWDKALSLPVYLQSISNKADDLTVYKRIPWEEAQKPPQGYSGNPFRPEPPDKPDPDKPIIVPLNFECLLYKDPLERLWLNFGEVGCRNYITPNQEVYFIVNDFLLFRVSDGVQIQALSARFGTDENSWCWSFNLTIPMRELEKVEPTPGGPIELEMHLNGVVWRFIVEGYEESENFAQPSLSIRAKSPTAYLDAPYAPTRTFNQSQAITTRQLAEAELTRPGLITGFELDWMLSDELGWLLPSDTWSFAELSPIAVINQIVQGSGGFLNSHNELRKLIVRPSYKVPPWEWGLTNPDKIIPRGLIKRRGKQWNEKPLYNGVYVSGERTGVNALVRRFGLGATFLAPPFSSPFITTQEAARVKGIHILSQGGKQSTDTLVLPFAPSLGLITPGMLLEVDNTGSNLSNWRGRVTGINFDINFDKSKGPTVNQTLTIERHYGGL